MHVLLMVIIKCLSIVLAMLAAGLRIDAKTYQVTNAGVRLPDSSSNTQIQCGVEIAHKATQRPPRGRHRTPTQTPLPPRREKSARIRSIAYSQVHPPTPRSVPPVPPSRTAAAHPPQIAVVGLPPKQGQMYRSSSSSLPRPPAASVTSALHSKLLRALPAMCSSRGKQTKSDTCTCSQPGLLRLRR